MYTPRQSMKKYNVAIVGATGLVGETMIKGLEERRFPVERLLPLASEKSEGKSVKFCGREIPVEILNKKSFKDIDFALFSAGAEVSKIFAPIAAESGAVAIDNTSCFRMAKDAPLIVPEVNGNILRCHCEERKRRSNLMDSVDCAGLPRPFGARNDVRKGLIIANPNCSTIQLVCVLKPIHDYAKIKRVVISTYQSTSGAGRDPKFVHPIENNCIPHIDLFEENGYTKEEMKVVLETRKILSAPSMNITCTAVRVPVNIGHSESVNIETEKKISAGEVKKILGKSPGIVVVDNPSKNEYPLAADAVGKNEVFVGRIREDLSIQNGIDLWIVADNLRKGAATNAVQIAELLI